MSVTIEVLAIKDLMSDIPDMYEYWSKLGVSTFEIQTLVPLGKASNNLLPTSREFVNVLKTLNKKEKCRIKVNCMWFTCLSPEIASYASSEIIFEECICGIGTLNVKTNGDVTICPFADFSVGNVFKQSLQDVYNSKLSRKYRTNFNENCRSCILFKGCYDRCRLISSIYGRNRSKMPYCLLYDVSFSSVNDYQK